MNWMAPVAYAMSTDECLGLWDSPCARCGAGAGVGCTSKLTGGPLDGCCFARWNELEKFDRVWHRLDDAGLCDSAWGMQHLRIWREWNAADQPMPLETFIRARADVHPGSAS